MRDMNKIFLMGRLGNNPILRETKNGTSVAHFSLATSRRVKSQEPEASQEDESPRSAASDGYAEETQWHRIVVWGKLGELCAQRLSKGNSVFVEGSVRTRKYSLMPEAAEKGQERIAFEVHAENVNFVNTGSSSHRNSLEAQAS